MLCFQYPSRFLTCRMNCNFLLFFFLIPGLFPAVLNLASMADITSNATCGLSGPEMFCKLVEHVPGQPVTNAQCRICNQNSAKPFGKRDSHSHTHLQSIQYSRRWNWSLIRHCRCDLTCSNEQVDDDCHVSQSTERHPIEYAIDGTNRWWQSPSIKNGMDYHSVTITLDLKQVANKHLYTFTILLLYIYMGTLIPQDSSRSGYLQNSWRGF